MIVILFNMRSSFPALVMVAIKSVYREELLYPIPWCPLNLHFYIVLISMRLISLSNSSLFFATNN